MFDFQMTVIVVLALSGIAFGALAIVREVNARRRVDAHVMKMMQDK